MGRIRTLREGEPLGILDREELQALTREGDRAMARLNRAKRRSDIKKRIFAVPKQVGRAAMALVSSLRR